MNNQGNNNLPVIAQVINRANIQYIVFLRNVRQVLNKRGLRAAMEYEERMFPHLAWWFIEEAPEAGIERYNFEFRKLYKSRSKKDYEAQIDSRINFLISGFLSIYAPIVFA
ncbi:hypothetical protein [Acinetobacter variabilis]|uniref:hypothetical protein n=1 Tax=Acinetobacter variabilis TaxID=70346 RepID=UPI0028A88F13|nr:hypothetical protein [Acinetobacter variabilis]